MSKIINILEFQAKRRARYHHSVQTFEDQVDEAHASFKVFLISLEREFSALSKEKEDWKNGGRSKGCDLHSRIGEEK